MHARTVSRHPLAVSVPGAVLSSVALTLVVARLPLDQNADHAGLHLAVALPAIALAVVLSKVWRPSASERHAAAARLVLLLGVAMMALGSVVEALGAFGYDDSGGRAGQLAALHDVGVAIAPVGIFLLLVGAVLAIAVALGARPALRRSRTANAGFVTAAVVVVAVVITVLVVGIVVGGV